MLDNNNALSSFDQSVFLLDILIETVNQYLKKPGLTENNKEHLKSEILKWESHRAAVMVAKEAIEDMLGRSKKIKEKANENS